jgi:DNA-binding response OmpR family regulator
LLLPEVKILVIVDTKSTKEAAKVLKYGATDVFPKPFDPQLLVERVKALLQQG